MRHCRKMRSCSSTRLAILFLLLSTLSLYSYPLMVASQQSYPSGDYFLSCTEYHKDNAGYLCEPSSPSCQTLAYFRVQTQSFSSLPNIAKQLFSTTASLIANASSLSSLTTRLKLGDGLYIPSACTCSGNFSSHNVTYTIMPGDTFQKIGNFTYEGLTTCQAMQDANPHFIMSDLVIGKTCVFPLRCACPSPEQTLRGIKFLVTYPVGSSVETISSVVDMFGVDQAEFLLANRLTNASQLFAASTLLLPFKEKPTLPPNSSFMFPSPSPRTPPPTSTPIMIHIAAASFAPIGIVILLLITIAAATLFAQKFQRKHALQKKYLQPNALALQIALPSPESRKPQIDLVQAMSDLATHDRLLIYTIDEILRATQGFCISMVIEGAVYRGTMNGQAVAVKKTVKDVSKEVQILQMLHHSNIISLLGFCIASPNQSYLVYEYAENGSLHGWLHGRAHSMGRATSSLVLEWHNRLQIALDIALAMEYIHDHTDPRFVHNDINSSNILLNSNMRGRMANFSSATVINATHEGVPCSEGRTSHNAKVSPKGDVYAFGQVLLEMVSGKKITEGEAGGLSAADTVGFLLSEDDAKDRLRAWMDTCIDSEVHMECVYGLMVLAQSCVAYHPSARPTARAVAFTLFKLLQTCLSQHPNPL